MNNKIITKILYNDKGDILRYYNIDYNLNKETGIVEEIDTENNIIHDTNIFYRYTSKDIKLSLLCNLDYKGNNIIDKDIKYVYDVDKYIQYMRDTGHECELYKFTSMNNKDLITGQYCIKIDNKIYGILTYTEGGTL